MGDVLKYQRPADAARPGMVPKSKTQPPAPLSDAERDRVAQLRALALAQAPEVAQIVRDLYAAGLISGWRALTRLEIH